MLNNKKDKIQREVIEYWIKNGKKGTAELATGVGKTILALHALYTMDKDDSTHLFLAETTERKKDLLLDIKLYNKLFGVDVVNDYKIKFYCYQTVYKWKNRNFGLVIADEIHNSLSPKYSEFFFNNHYQAIIGLSATIDRKTKYEINNKVITKGDLIDKIAPSIYKYSISDAKNDGIGRILNVYVINQELNDVEKSIKAGNAKKQFLQTEKAAYDYWDKEHRKSWFIENEELKSLKIRITAHKRSNILFNLPSKIKAVKELLNSINGKSILFGNSLDSLLKITPNVVSSRNDEAKNNYIRDQFDKGMIQIIGSFKKLRQGANLKDLDNCIIMSYYSSEVHQIQQWGRLRQNGSKIGNVFILLTKNTQEEVWFSKMMENMNDFNVIYCDNVEDCINKYKINEEN